MLRKIDRHLSKSLRVAPEIIPESSAVQSFTILFKPRPVEDRLFVLVVGGAVLIRREAKVGERQPAQIPG